MEPQQLCALENRGLGEEGKERDVIFEAGGIQRWMGYR